MNAKVLIESFSEFAHTRDIDRPTMMKILEEVFRSILRKLYGSDHNFDVIINPDNGDLQINRYLEIVDDNDEVLNDPEVTDKVAISQARKVDPDFEVGEEYAEAIDIEDFGRRMVSTARQTLMQKVRDLEKDRLFKKYIDLVGEIITTEVHQILGREILLLDSEGNELSLPKSEMIPKDHFRKGQAVRAVVHRVEMINGNPKIVLSRTSPVFLERLFEQEVPEIYDGLITIRKVVREPGERAKVAVESYDERIDPVGACVGVRGSRIHGIVRELQNENIDVIAYTENFELLIQRLLSPARVNRIKVEPEKSRVAVYLKPDQVSLAIGKGGHNVKLAGKLIDMEIDTYRELDGTEEEDDIPIDEFNDEIEQWILDELKKVGLDTARSVLALSKEDLVRRTDLEEETIEDLLAIIKQELD